MPLNFDDNSRQHCDCTNEVDHVLVVSFSRSAWCRSAVALLGFIRREGALRAVPHRWLPVVATLLVGVSCGLPLFLYLREQGPSNRS